jgi:hypothetical protein
MATTSPTHLIDSPQLHTLARRLTRWRASRRPGQRIPEALWNAATRLARTHGVSAISSALRLGYYELQRRLAATTATTGLRRGDSAGPHFIQLTPLERPCEGGTLEVLKPCGQRLVLRLAHSTAQEMMALMQTFLRDGG